MPGDADAIYHRRADGVGKTTFANLYLPDEAQQLEFVNADLIAKGLSPFDPDSVSMEAGKIALKRIRELIAQRTGFTWEMTMSGRTAAGWLREAREAGYVLKAYFLWVRHPETTISRIYQRVTEGGHNIPEETSRRRFFKTIQNFFEIYRIGQTGRQSPVTPYPNQNFLGLIDEVRISGVARSDTQMLFENQPIVASATATPAAEAAPTQPAPEKGKTSTREDKRSVEDGGNGRSNADNALIAGALVSIAGLLCWLVYVLRRLVFGGGTGAQTTALAKVVPADALQNAAAGFARGEESLISQAGYQSHHAQPRSNGSGSTTHFKQKTVIPVVEEVVVAERKEYETGAEPGFRGVMRRVGLEDLIQLECMNSKSTLLDIANEKLRGRIYIERGEIIHAVAGKLSGESALHKLLALRGGEFSLKPLEQPERRTIHGQWMQLLMEAAQLRDEETSFLTATEPKGFSFAPSTSTPEEIVAMATLLGEHPHVKELLVVAREGEVLYSSKCADVAGRATVCNDLLEAAKAVSTHLPLGDFHHVEIVNNQSRTVIQPAQGHHLLIGTPSDSPG